MAEKVKVFKVTLCVVDNDGIGEDELQSVLENTRYPNRCIYPSVEAVDVREVDWSDDHPLNIKPESSKAFRELFGEDD